MASHSSSADQPRVLVTGIDSFTGQHLKQHLEQSGFCVFGTCRKPPASTADFVCDITNKNAIAQVLATTRPGYVIHLAGISFVGHPVVEDFYRVNVLGTQNLLDALVESGLVLNKVVLASSATVYGNQGLAVLDESICPMPANHYGISKLAMEHLARTYFAKLPIIVTRPFNYVGVGQPEHFVIPKIVAHFKRGEKLIELGNIAVEREFNDVRFACEVYKRLLEIEPHGEIVNLCSGQGVALQRVIDTLNDLAGYNIDVRVNPAFVRANELPSLVGSPNKLISLVGELTQVNLQQTLESMYLNS
ncbi:MAG: GDP-mannose 4,6-dehydratase [Thiotrichales bacterium]|nr:GDP-mannose 4,6-dehydratase [Thiotrichales bacterium]